MKRSLARYGFAFLLALVALVAAGCSTTEPENISDRPWNSPRGWETGGFPSTINQGR